MMELVLDFRKHGGVHAPINVSDPEVEMVEILMFLSVNITNDLSWNSHIDVTAKKKAYQGLTY